MSGPDEASAYCPHLGSGGGRSDIKFPIGRDAPFSIPSVYSDHLLKYQYTKVQMSDGRDVWFFHRHQDVQELMMHPLLSSNRSDPGFPAVSPGGKSAFQYFATFLISMDGEEHARARKRIIPQFSMSRMRSFRPRIEEIVDDAINDLISAGPGADLVQHISNVVPRRVIAEIMGVSPKYLSRFYDLAREFLSRDKSAPERDQIARLMRQNMNELVEHKQSNLGDDVLSREIARQEREEGAIDVDALASLSQLMLLAGHESTCEMISLGIIALLEHPDQRRILLDNPAHFPKAVNELIRFFSVSEIGMARVAVGDFEFAGARIRSGEGVIASNIGANRDASVFDHPDEIQLDRTPNPHLAQGYGPHQCIGMNLAQVELSAVYERVFRAIPTLRLAPNKTVNELPYRYHDLIFGVRSLPVTW